MNLLKLMQSKTYNIRISFTFAARYKPNSITIYMKKIILLSILSVFAFQSKGEVWFDVGAKGAYAPGVFTNPYILSSENQRLAYNHGYFVGGKIGINFGLTHSATIDVLYSTTTQTLINNDKTNNYTVSLSSIDLPIMYRNNGDNGSYGEIGPQLSFTRKAQADLNGVSQDAKNSFNSTNMGVAFGFGQYIGGGNVFGLTMGLRFAYSFGDIVASSSQHLTGDPVFQPLGPDETSTYTYKASGRLYAGVVVEANFNIGYITQGSRCSKRTKFKMF